MVIDNKFNIKEEVYLKTDPSQNVRIVTAIQVTDLDYTYQLMCGVETSWHYDFEITKEKNVLVSV